MKTLYFIRHAEAEGQPFSSALTKKGREQAESLIAFFMEREINRIYSSPYVRAIETISPLANSRGLDIEEGDRLGERVLSSAYFAESFGFEHLMKMTNPDVFEIIIHPDEVRLNRIWK